MPSPTVFVVGKESEVAHHAAPLRREIPVAQLEPAQVLERARPGDLAIFYSEHFDGLRDCIRQLRAKSVATIYAIDGILEWRNLWTHREFEPACPWTMRPVLCDKVACIGAHQARILEAWGNGDRAELIGIPRLDAETSRAPQLGDDLTRPRSDPFRVLVMTAKFPAFTPEQHQITLRSLRDLRDWFRTHPRLDGRAVQVTWRLTRGLEQELEVVNELRDLAGQDLARQLAAVDAVITTPSTSVLEAMLRDLPVAVLDYHHVPDYVVPAWKIPSHDRIESVVRELANPSAERMYFQRSILRDELACDGSATARLAQLVRDMLTQANECVRQVRPLSFAARMVPTPRSADASFPAAQLYPDQPVFRDSNVLRLQAELGHARREIVVLQSEIKQLRSELGQAHRIFEQIQRHPIAGPVVRVRQKMMDAWRRWRQRVAPGTPTGAPREGFPSTPSPTSATPKSP